ncbi:MAG: DNA double-strand break repair nuclease NurA [archaeon]|nr:DNA double-strand break repair nuclease NurA [archaeon]
MLNDAIKNLVKRLETQIRDQYLGEPIFKKSEYETFPLISSGFNPIKKQDFNDQIAFIDGGNIELLGAPNFSIQLNRVYFNIFKNNKRMNSKEIPHKIEFFSSTVSIYKDEEIFYDTSLFPVRSEFEKYLPSEKDLSFSSFDPNLVKGNRYRADISHVATIPRKFSEWTVSKSIIEQELNANDIIVIDGTLQTGFPNETKYAESVYRVALKNQIYFTGLSKTCRFFTTTGLSLIGAAQRLAEMSSINFPEWYFPIAKCNGSFHRANMYFVKLNMHAKNIFRFEILKEQADELEKSGIDTVLSGIASNSKDLSYPGYPYGLIDADHRARVRAKEIRRYRTRIEAEIAKTSGSLNKFNKHMSAIDAHEKLNDLAGK